MIHLEWVCYFAVVKKKRLLMQISLMLGRGVSIMPAQLLE